MKGPILVAGALMLLTACSGSSAEPTTTSNETTGLVTATQASTTVNVITGPSDHPETDAIVAEWADAWVDCDGERVAALYEPTTGVYSDAAVPYERQGREEIARMVGNHCFGIDYTSSPVVSITYTDTGAVVQWIWEGTIIRGADGGTEFSMRAQTTFQIEEGLIVRSTDDYELGDAPWG